MRLEQNFGPQDQVQLKKERRLGSEVMQGACGASSLQAEEAAQSWFLPPHQPWDLRGAGHVHSGHRRMDFLEMVRQDPHGGTFQILPRASPLANTRDRPLLRSVS